jgi:hypothetical protein
MLIVMAYHPQCITDLLRYSLLGLRTAQKFSSKAWLTYDVAFRKDAAARGLFDWSSLNAELFNFHVTSVRMTSPSHLSPTPISGTPLARGARTPSREPRGTDSSHIICHSWNWGHCSSLYPVCRFRHVCDFPRCDGTHRRVDVHRWGDQTTTGRMLPPKRPRAA